MMKKRMMTLLTAATMTAALAAGTTAMADHSKSVTIAFTEGLIKLDPQDQSVATGLTMNDMIFDTLLQDNHDGTFDNRLAESVEFSDDNMEITIKIHEGVTFHDGEKLDADDVVCSFQRLIDTPTLYSYISYWGSLESVEKVDDYTVKVKLNAPEVAAARQGLGSLVVIPNEAYEKNGTALFTDGIMTGSGPWKFVEWVDGQYLKMEKNPDYWNGGNNSYFDEVYLRFVPEASTAISGQIAGDLDAYYNVNGGIPADLQALYAGSEDKCELLTVPVSSIDYLGFQCGENSVFNDVNVRRAFSMAIDRQTIIDALLGGGAVNPGVMNDMSLGYDESLDVDWYHYDPEAAKELLNSTGYAGEEVTISSVAAFNTLALAVADYANAIGFNCKAEVVEAATLADIRATADYDMFIVTAIHGSGDPYQFLSFRVFADGHHSEYVNDELHSLIEQSNQEADVEARNELLKQINAIIADECAPMVSLARLQTVQSVNYGITGITFAPDGFCLCRNVDYDPSLEK